MTRIPEAAIEAMALHLYGDTSPMFLRHARYALEIVVPLLVDDEAIERGARAEFDGTISPWDDWDDVEPQVRKSWMSHFEAGLRAALGGED